MRSGYYEDARFCHACNTYVRYLLAPQGAYCVRCGDRVGLYSKPDLNRVLDSGREPCELEAGERAAGRRRLASGS